MYETPKGKLWFCFSLVLFSILSIVFGFCVKCLLICGWVLLVFGLWVWYPFWGGQVGGEVLILGTRVVLILGRSIREPSVEP